MNANIRAGLDELNASHRRTELLRRTGSSGEAPSWNKLRRTALAISGSAVVLAFIVGGIYQLRSSDIYAQSESVDLDYESYAESIKSANQHPIRAGGYSEECHCGFSRLGVPYLRPGPSTGVGTVIGPVRFEDALEIAEVISPQEIRQMDVPLDAVASLPKSGAYVTAVGWPNQNPNLPNVRP